jgi:hypothetical protein
LPDFGSICGFNFSVEVLEITFSVLDSSLPFINLDTRSPAAPINNLAASDPKPQTRSSCEDGTATSLKTLF